MCVHEKNLVELINNKESNHKMSKVIVLTGAGGVLCSALAKALAKEGHKIAVLDLRIEAANEVAEKINTTGGKAIGIEANVLEKESLENAKNEVNSQLGSCDILINGAGGNHPLGTTSNPFLEEEDLLNKEDGFKTFFPVVIYGLIYNLCQCRGDIFVDLVNRG